MSSRRRAMEKAGYVDLFQGMAPDEQRHLARRATKVPNKRREQSRKACRGGAHAFSRGPLALSGRSF